MRPRVCQSRVVLGWTKSVWAVSRCAVGTHVCVPIQKGASSRGSPGLSTPHVSPFSVCSGGEPRTRYVVMTARQSSTLCVNTSQHASVCTRDRPALLSVGYPSCLLSQFHSEREHREGTLAGLGCCLCRWRPAGGVRQGLEACGRSGSGAAVHIVAAASGCPSPSRTGPTLHQSVTQPKRWCP